MRWLVVVAFIVAMLPAGVSAQVTNCYTTPLGYALNTTCYTTRPARLSDVLPPPPFGYRYLDSFLLKAACRLASVNYGRECAPWGPEDQSPFVPIAPPNPPPTAVPPAAPARPPWQAGPCEFKLGFKAIADQIPDVVGSCGENEHWNTTNGDSLQQTRNGLLVWRKADNFTAFTDGFRTWVNGPAGLQQRLNTECFNWEAGCPGR